MRLRRNAKIELLRRVPLFDGCSQKELGQISSLADELAQPAGTTLIKEGAKGREFFVDLASKQVAVARGLGYNGAYIGGHMPIATYDEILDRAAAIGDRAGIGGALPEYLPAAHERTCGPGRRGVKGEDRRHFRS